MYKRQVVSLARAQQTAGNFGGLAETQGQQAGGQGIQAAGVATFFRTEQMPRTLQGLVGAQALRLVEQQDACLLYTSRCV